MEPLDEEDQEKLVQEFQEEVIKQQEQINQSFRYLVYGVVLICIFVTLYMTTELLGGDDNDGEKKKYNSFEIGLVLLHGLVCSPTLHYATTIMMKTQFTFSSTSNHVLFHPANLTVIIPLALFNILCTVVPPLLFETRTTTVALHGTLLLSNICTIGFALIIHFDQKSTEKSMKELKTSKYHFKSW